MICRYCGETIVADDLLHVLRCDGQQGRIEAALEPVPPPHVEDTGAFRRVRATDPDTSHDAAAPDRARDRDRAYAALHEAGIYGLTDFELGERIDRQQTSAGKRRGELRDAGLVCDSGQRRQAPSGSLAIVWMAVVFMQYRARADAHQSATV